MKKDNLKLSVVILTHNEQENITDCIKSLSGLKVEHEILVIDDESTDKTVEIATKLGATVNKHALNNNFSYQRNRALSKTKGDWVFFLDADERVGKVLVSEIDQLLLNPGTIAGAYFKRYDYFGNKLLRYGEIGHIRLMRLAKKNAGLWQGTVDEIWEITGNSVTLNNSLLHYSHPTITQFLESINARSTIFAKQLFDKGIKIRWYDWGKPLAKFVVNYIYRLGFLDGLPGLVFAALMSFHSFLVRGKLYLLWKRKTN